MVVKPFIDNKRETENKIQYLVAELLSADDELIILESSLSKTEVSYNIALDVKNKELPILFKQEAKFNEAVEIKYNTSIIDKEMLHIISDKNSYDKSSSLARKEFEDVQNNIKICLEEICLTENRLIQIKVDPVYREKVAKAFSKGEEYVELYKVNQEIKMKLKDKALEVENITFKISELQKHFPGDSSILLKKHSDQNTLREQLQKSLEIEKSIGDDSLKLNSLEEKICQGQINYNEIDLSIKIKREEFIAIEKQLNKFEIERLASKLSIGLLEGDACPVCGSIHHTKLAMMTKVLQSNEFKELKLGIETWNKSKDEEDKRLSKLKEEKTEIDKKEVLLGETLKQERLAIQEIKRQQEISDQRFQEVTNTLNILKQEIGVESIKAETEKINAFDKESIDKERNLKILRERISGF